MPKKKTSLIRSPDFKTIYAVGAIGTWTPYDFRINFYSEKVIEDEDEAFVNDAQIILSPKATKEFALWLMQNINDFEATYGKSKSATGDEAVSVDDTKFKSDIRSELKSDIKNEVQQDLQKYLSNELRNKINKNFKDELKTDLRKYFKQNLQNDIKKDIKVVPSPQLKKDLKKVLKADLKQDLREDIKKDIREEIKRDLHGAPEATQKLKTKPKPKPKPHSENVKTPPRGRMNRKIDSKKKK